MKKLFFYSALATLTLFSCQNDGDLNTNSKLESGLDPQTPLNAQPFILDENAPNGKTKAPPTGTTGWSANPVFSDEFNSTTFATTKWAKMDSGTITRKVGGSQDPNIKWWGYKPAQVTLNGTKLVLSSLKKDTETLHCGAIKSDKGTATAGERTYGYFEANIDIQDPKYGSHTAFWMQGDNMTNIEHLGENGAEIDIFESCWTNDKTRTTIHIDGYGSSHQSTGGALADEWGASGMKYGYHLWGLDWSKKYLKVYYDGVFKKEFTAAKWIPLENEYMILSTGAAFGKDDTFSGAKGFTPRKVGSVTSSHVDWVRVWSNSGTNYKN